MLGGINCQVKETAIAFAEHNAYVLFMVDKDLFPNKGGGKGKKERDLHAQIKME